MITTKHLLNSFSREVKMKQTSCERKKASISVQIDFVIKVCKAGRPAVFKHFFHSKLNLNITSPDLFCVFSVAAPFTVKSLKNLSAVYEHTLFSFAQTDSLLSSSIAATSKNSSTAATLLTCAAANRTRTASRPSRTFWPTSC